MKSDARGAGHRWGSYRISDRQMAAGSTLGSPTAALVIKATGAVERFYSIEQGAALFGTMVLHHWETSSGAPLLARPGEFVIEPCRQDHDFELSNGVEAHETIFVLSGAPHGQVVDPPIAYYCVTLTNAGKFPQEMDTFAAADLRGDSARDLHVSYDPDARAFVVSNRSNRHSTRLFACSAEVASWEVTGDAARVSATRFPGPLRREISGDATDPIALFHLHHRLEPGGVVSVYFTLSFNSTPQSQQAALRELSDCPSAQAALRRTETYYDEVLSSAVVTTPDAEVNRGVLWAKANMLRTQLMAKTGWCAVNDPTRSNNSVGRDTFWTAFGADYITPDFSRESLLWYATHLEECGMVVEYYDIRSGESEDYGLNVNDNTPLMILALWHHYATTGDAAFLEGVYPAAKRAADYILSQRNDQGLVWCTSTETSNRGIVGWRNVIKDYRLSGASTEVNSECYAALQTIAKMARLAGHHDDSARYLQESEALRAAINEHLMNPDNGLYYLNIDVDGTPNTDVTADLVFPVMFGVPDHETAAHIVSRLSAPAFWTEAGIRTVPRDSIRYGPTHGYGLLGGVWVGMTFWYAFAAAPFSPESMSAALSASFQHYSRDPLRNNTVPGQFSEWLHGESLTNQGMMLSPWFPPRYLWAAIEGAAGLDLSGERPRVVPRLAPDWKWLGVRNVWLAGKSASWFVVRTPDLSLYATFDFEGTGPYGRFDEDVTGDLWLGNDDVTAIAMRKASDFVVLVGNTTPRTSITSIALSMPLEGVYRLRIFNSLRSEWREERSISPPALAAGLTLQLECKGFCVLELRQEA